MAQAFATDRAESGAVSAIRAAVPVVSVLLIIAIAFVTFWYNSAMVSEERQQRLYHLQMEQFQHVLRDWADVVRERGTIAAQTQSTDDLPFSTSRIPISDYINSENPLPSEDEPLREGLSLSFAGKQARDQLIWLTFAKFADRSTMKIAFASRINLNQALRLSGSEEIAGLQDAAIVKEGHVLLVLRGDAPWPDRFDPPPSDSKDAASPATGDREKDTDENTGGNQNGTDIMIGGEARLMMTAPLDLGRPFAVNDGALCQPRECNLVVLGTRPGPLDAITAMPPLVRFGFSAIIALLMLMVPIIKLKLINANGSLHWLDGTAIIGSVPLVTAILGLLLLAINQWYWTRDQLDRVIQSEVQALAQDASERTIWASNYAVSKILAHSIPPTKVDPPLAGSATKWRSDWKPDISRIDEASCWRGKHSQSAKFCIRSIEERDADTGNFRAKLPNSSITSRSSIASRDYFQRAMSGDLIPLMSPLGDRSEFWSLSAGQVRLVYNGGSLSVIVLKRRPETCQAQLPMGKAGNRCVYIVITTPLIRFGSDKQQSSASPPLIERALLHPDSFEVLEHSRPGREFSEHMVDQLRDAAPFLKAVRALPRSCNTVTSSRVFAVQYGRDTVRMVVSRVCQNGWIAVSWYDRNQAQYRATTPAIFAAGVIVLLGLICMMVAVGIGMWSKDRLIRSLWPVRRDPVEDRSRPRVPWERWRAQRNFAWSVVIVNMVTMTLAILLAGLGYSLGLIALMVGLLVSLVLLSCIRWRKSRPPEAAASDATLRSIAEESRMYRCAQGLVIVALAILPTLLAYFAASAAVNTASPSADRLIGVGRVLEWAAVTLPHPLYSTRGPAADGPRSGLDWIWLLGLAFVSLVLLAGAVAWLLRQCNRGVLGLHHFEFRSTHPGRSPADFVQDNGGLAQHRKLLFVDFPASAREALEQKLRETPGARMRTFNLGSLRNGELGETPAELAARRWLITGFEAILSSRDLRLQALDLLEQVASQEDSRIYFFSAMPPLVRLSHQRERERLDLADKGQPNSAMGSGESQRWAELFEMFLTVQASGDSAGFADDASTPERATLKSVFMQEAKVIPNELIRLQIIPPEWSDPPRSLNNAPNPNGGSSVTSPPPANLVEQVHEYLATILGDYYQNQWLRSSKEEQIILYHLAHGRFINTENFSPVNNLLTRRLIVRDPHFRLLNKSFAYWIRTLEHPRWFESFRKQVETDSVWTMLRAPLLLLALAASVLLTIIEKYSSGPNLAAIPAIAASIPLIWSRFAEFRKLS